MTPTGPPLTTTSREQSSGRVSVSPSPSVSSPLLEITASHLLGTLAHDLEAVSLPGTPRAISPQPELSTVAPHGTWRDSLFLDSSPPEVPPRQNSLALTPVSRVRATVPEFQASSSSLVATFQAAGTQGELDAAVAKLVCKASALNKVRAPSTTNRPRREIDVTSLPPAAVQRFYNRNRKRSFEQLTGHKSQALRIPISDLGDSLRASMGTTQSHSAQDLLVHSETSDAITGASVLPDEVVARLNKATNSAPSPLDRLTYRHLKKFDPDGRVLAALFSKCLSTGLTPSAWREYVTVLIYKRPKDRSPAAALNPRNWRPIALLPTIPKVFTGILADRLTQWAEIHNALSPAQKGCYAGEGCFEHIHVLSSLRDLSSPSRQVHLAFLDLADAFTSVPHTLIFDTLRARGVHENTVRCFQALYSGTVTTVANQQGETTTIPVRSGVRQGCPASPILFALTIEPILLASFQSGSGVSAGGDEFHVLAYADDLVLIASSASALQEKLHQVSTTAHHLGLRFNAAKCASLAWGLPSPPSQMVLNGIPIKAIANEEFYNYLGTPVGLSSWQSSHSLLSTFQSELEAIARSTLKPCQKIDAFRTFIFPKLSYHLRASCFPSQDFDRKKGGIDRWVARFAKRVLHLPTRACEAYLHTPRYLGGVGISSARTEMAVLKVAHAFRMLTSGDPAVRRLTLASLHHLLGQRCLIGSPSLEECVAYLNGDLLPVQQGRGSWWTQVLQSIRHLRKLCGLVLTTSDGNIALQLPTDTEATRIIGAQQRAEAIRVLHAAVGDAAFTRWRALPNQGKAAALYGAEPDALAAYDPWWGVRFCDWRFLHRARLNLVPTNAVKAAFFQGANPCCRVYGYESETLGHVLGRCWHHSANLNRRHNSIQDAVVAALPESEDDTEVLVNRCPTAFSSSERIDLQVVNSNLKTATLVDFKCPFESGNEAFTTARQRNEHKYAPLAERYRRLGFVVTLDTICVGALGTWDPQNSRPLKTLGVPKCRVKALRTTICRAVLHLSRNIWVEHVTGTQQTY